MSNADVTADSYHNYKRDVQMLRELGVDIYRFSISWSRLLPNGLINKINENGTKFYNNYINEMLKYNITPMATLYHWDLPQKLQDLGGFMNPDFPKWFEDYAKLAYKLFGDRVKHWVTFNEPREICYEGYGYTIKPPFYNASDYGMYLCAKNLLLAHARAYHAYHKDFKQGGVCGITFSVTWFGPLTDTVEDEIATEIRRQREWGVYTEPIYSKKGGFPIELSNLLEKKSLEAGYPTSVLPKLTDKERRLIRGTYDFFGMNHYSGALISATKYKVEDSVHSILSDILGGMYFPPEWYRSSSSWLMQAPNSIYNALVYLHKKYENTTFYITENGWSDSIRSGLEDNDRIRYYRAALESVLDTIEAGVDLKLYTAWSLMDNFEWIAGYTERLGLYQVDFSSPTKTRTPKKSAFVYKQIIKTRQIDPDYEPKNRTMWIEEGH